MGWLSQNLRSKFRVSGSLASDFRVFFWVVIWAVLIFSLWFGWRTYLVQTYAIQQDLRSQTDRLEDVWEDLVRYSEHLMHYISREVGSRTNDGNDLETVHRILQSYRILEKEVISWNSFSWVDCFHNLTVSSTRGLLQAPFRSLVHRDYIPKTIEEPGRIHLGLPVYGALTHQWSIPAGYGVQNAKGRYLGAVVTAFIVESLELKLETAINTSGVSFYLIDSNFRVVAQSPSNRRPLSRSLMTALMADRAEQMMGRLVWGSSEPWYKPKDFLYYRVFPRYPYMIAVHYDPEIVHRRVWGTIIDHAVEFMLIGMLCLFLLFLLRQRVLRPVVQLSEVSIAMTSGIKEDIVFPETDVEEIRTLIEVVSHLHETTVALRGTCEQTEKMSHSLRSAMSYMTHELKTPLNLIIGFSEMLMKDMYGVLTPKQRSYVKLIFDAGKHQQNLVADFLRTAENEQSQTENRVLVDMVELLEEQLYFIRRMAEEKNISIQVENRLIVTPLLRLDRVKMGQVLLNLLSNALKYNKPGGWVRVVLEIGSRGLPHDDLLVRIIDGGIGIAEEHLDNIFNRFVRLGPSMDGDSTGLGLSFARMVVEDHQGMIVVTSEMGVGSEFVVHLPIGPEAYGTDDV
jgi:signal transduction histidine kinase